MTVPMGGRPNIGTAWVRIADHAGQSYRTITGLEFTYDVPRNDLLASRTIDNRKAQLFGPKPVAEALEHLRRVGLLKAASV